MKVVVTAKIKLTNCSDILRETMRVFSQAVQFCINTAWAQQIYQRNALHNLCYQEIRGHFQLHSQLACNAIKQALEMVKGAHSKPQVSEKLSTRYNFPRCASVNPDWTILSLSTMKGRIKFPLEVPECFQQYLEWEVQESTLIQDFKGRFFFCFTFSKEVDIQLRNNGCKILGVDLGVNTLAVTSDATFFEGIKSKRIQREQLVAELQAKGTSATRRKLKSAGSRWKRFMTWVNHNVSKQIVAKLSEGDVLVLEDLSNIRQTAKYNPWNHKWAFRELQAFLDYKASKKGIRVVYVDPAYTSQECNRCHNRQTSRHQGFVKCQVCGHTLNADLNGARNIARRYRRITGLGLGKHPPNLACDEVKVNNRVEIATEHRQKRLA